MNPSTLINSCDSDSDGELPEVNFSPSLATDKGFTVDTIVWTKWRGQFWPALVRSCNLKRKKLSVIFVDTPLKKNGQECRITVRFKNTIKFDGSEGSKQLMKSGLDGSNSALKKAIETAQSYILKKDLDGFTGSAVQYLHDPFGHFLHENRPASSPAISEKCKTTEEDAKMSRIINSSEECSESGLNTKSDDEDDPETEEAAEKPAEETIQFTKLQESLNQKIMAVLKSDACKDYMLNVLQGRVHCPRHKEFVCLSTPKRRKFNVFCYQDFLKHSQISDIVDYVKPLVDNQTSDVFYPVRYTMDVLVPEAVAFALQAALEISKSEAEDILAGGHVAEALLQKFEEDKSTLESS